MTRLLLIGLLTVLSFSANSIDEQPIKPWVEPDNKMLPLYTLEKTVNVETSIESFEKAVQWVIENRINGKENSGTARNGECKFNFPSNPAPNFGQYIQCRFEIPIGCAPNGTCTYAFADYKYYNRFWYRGNQSSKVCPPAGFPDYVEGPKPESPQNPTHEVCFSKFKPCPLGFFKNEVTLSSGESKCVPISCPDKGTRVNNVFNKNGAIGVGSSGTYCDGKCSYTIQPTDAPYNGSSFVFGTSNGAVCGQGQDKDIKFTPTDKEGTCTTSQLSTGANFQTCTEGDGTAPEEDNAEGELDDKAQDASVDPLTKPSKYQGADCSITADQLYCIGTEIIEALDHQTAETKKQQDEKHNKLVELQKDISEYVENQQRDRFTKQSSQSQSETSLILGGLSEITTAIKTGSAPGAGGGDGGSDDSLTEEYNPDSQQVDDAISEANSQLQSAADDLDSQADAVKGNYSPDSSFWNVFEDLSNVLPSDMACNNPVISYKDFEMTVDICSKADLIKTFLAFAMLFATFFRVFYQTQIVLRIVAESKA